MTFRRIGIFGGMGPQATIQLLECLLVEVVSKDDSAHIPLLIDMNPQVPSRIDFLLEGGAVDPAPVLAEMAHGLQRTGAEGLAMPCNTVHTFAAQIEEAVSIPFLNMPRLAAGEVALNVAPGDPVGVLTSPATQKTGLFAAQPVIDTLDALTRHLSAFAGNSQTEDAATDLS